MGLMLNTVVKYHSIQCHSHMAIIHIVLYPYTCTVMFSEIRGPYMFFSWN